MYTSMWCIFKVKKNTVIEFNMELEYCVYIHGNTIAFLYSVFVHVSEQCLACLLLYMYLYT